VGVEFLLQLVGVELRQHRVKGDAQAGQHCELMVAQVVEGVRERVHRSEVRGVTFHQQVMEGVLDVGRKLQRVVVDRPEHRVLDTELLFDFLAGLQDVHQTGHDDSQNLPKTARQFRSDHTLRHAGAREQFGEIRGMALRTRTGIGRMGHRDWRRSRRRNRRRRLLRHERVAFERRQVRGCGVRPQARSGV
jgi:hypothetical protein